MELSKIQYRVAKTERFLGDEKITHVAHIIPRIGEHVILKEYEGAVKDILYNHIAGIVVVYLK